MQGLGGMPGGSPPTVFVAQSQPWKAGGGAAVHAWAVIERLARRGFTVIAQGEAGPPGVEIVPFGRRGTLAAVRRADVLYIRVDGELNRERSTAYAWLRRPRPAVVWEVNATVAELSTFGRDPKQVARQQRKRTLLARGCDRAVVVSDELVSYARDALGISEVTVVENGAELPEEMPPPSATSPLERLGFVALWMGSGWFPWQAVDTAVETARVLETKDPDVTVAVVGSARPREVTAPPSALILGQARREEAAAHLRASAVALCLYHDTPWAPDGFYMSPVKLFEAWSAGVPVIATDLSSIRRIVRDGETGLLVADDPAAVADAIVRLKNDPGLRERLVDGGRKAVREHYNWDRTADQVAEVLRAAIAARRNR